MKINFDNISTRQPQNMSKTSLNPIKIAIESPVYSSVIRELSPHNYQTEITTINSVINLPSEVATFIQNQVEKQIKYNDHSETINEINFMERTSSEIKLVPIPTSQENQTYFGMQQRKNHNKNPYLNSTATFNYKKHKCAHHMPTQVKQVLKQVSQLTGRPFLYPTAYNKKASQIRKLQSQQTDQIYSVYDNLYRQARTRKLKAELNKTKQLSKIPEPKPKTNKDFNQTKISSYEPIYNRLNKILEARQARRKQSQGIDLATGRELFIPDTSFSKQSYKIFFNSLSKEKIKIKNKQNKRTQFAATNKKLLISQNTTEQKKKQIPIDTRTIQYFTQIFYSQNQPSVSLATSTASNPLKKSQFLVLHPFLHEIEEIESKKYEMQTTVSSAKQSTAPAKVNNVLSKQQFQSKFRKYYDKLSLLDRQTLRKEAGKKKKNQLHHENQYEEVISFRPTINVRSSSLDNLAKGHSRNIYYV